MTRRSIGWLLAALSAAVAIMNGVLCIHDAGVHDVPGAIIFGVFTAYWAWDFEKDVRRLTRSAGHWWMNGVPVEADALADMDSDEAIRFMFLGELACFAIDSGFPFKRYEVWDHGDHIHFVFHRRWYQLFENRERLRQGVELAIQRELVNADLPDIRFDINIV